MKQILLFILSLTLLIPTPAGSQEKTNAINMLDENNQRTGGWEIFYDSGELKETGTYEKGQRTGLWKSFYKNGTLKHEITYDKGMARGPAKFYYRDGQLWEEGYWDIDHWKGTYILYHANGQKFYEWNYNDAGARSGEQKYFHANGEVQYTGNWKNGNIDGEILVFNNRGELQEKREYTDEGFNKSTVVTSRPENADEDPDRKILPFYGTGHYTLQSMDGLTIKEGYFRDGILQDGKHFIYNERDSLIETRIVENGKYVK
ncbi:toxin-antitoxin system YwqK family antitoxin [Marinilabilia salmonicolor]|uniref:toxin-antitoxin system YwqK family antitoxin n=1 Tax=Marinilabilia salmonicolor TaxID=989 RepID=UPI000299E326|nr:toxin-antitoxin system YwqK family antitoxin [Marinilabilia salmonicolor]